MNHDKRNHEVLIGWSLHAAGMAAVVLAIWAFHGFVYQPLRHQRARSTARIDQIETLLSKSAGLQQKHRSLGKQLKELEQSIASMQGRLPKELEKNEFESHVRHISETVGLKRVGFRPHRAEATSSHRQAEIGFHCHGSFGSMCRFLHEVDHLVRITKISNLGIESDPDTASNQIRGSFVLYYGVTTHDTDKNGDVL